MGYKDGLSDDHINSITQDDLGYIWIGTENGLNRFDGKEFKIFYQGDKAIDLPGNNINLLKYLGNDELGICTFSGFAILNTRTMKTKKFKVPYSEEDMIQALSILDVAKIDSGKILITTRTGLYVFTQAGKLIYKYSHTEKEHNSLIYDENIFDNGNNEYIISGEKIQYGILKSNPFRYQWYTSSLSNPYPEFASKSFPRKNIFKLQKNEYIFSLRRSGLAYPLDSIIHYNSKTRRQIIISVPQNFKADIFAGIRYFGYNDSTILVASSSHVIQFLFNKTSGKSNWNPSPIFEGKWVNSFFKDKQDRLWVASRHGIYMQIKKTKLMQTFPIPAAKGVTKYSTVTEVLQHKDKIYIGRHSNGDSSLWILDSTYSKVLKKILFHNVNSLYNEVRNIRHYRDDTLLLTSPVGLLWFDTKSEKYGEFIITTIPGDSIINKFGVDFWGSEDMHGNTWGVYHNYKQSLQGYWTLKNKIFTPFIKENFPQLKNFSINNFVTDAYGDVWMSADNGGIFRYNWNKKIIDTVISYIVTKNRTIKSITKLLSDRNGSLWMQGDYSIAYGNLMEYRIKEKKFYEYDNRNGFPSSTIWSADNFSKNEMILNLQNKLIILNTQTKTFRIFTSSDGVPDDVPSQSGISHFDQQSQRFFSPYTKHIGVIEKNKNKAIYPTQLLINEIILNNNKSVFHPSENLSFSYKDKNVTLRYSVMDIEQETDYYFQYKLDNQNWVYIGTSNELRLGNLKSGTHLLTLKTATRDGQEIFASIKIKIIPPFWQTLWFIALVSFLLLYAVYYLYQSRIKKIKLNAEIDSKLAGYEMKALQSQMNRHFIFNALNSIKEMILLGKNDDASRYLSKFGHLIRLNLDHNTKNFITIKENNEQLTAYLEMEALRFSNFNWTIEANSDLEIDELMIPPMMVQPIAENAIWHGLLPKEENKILRISYKQEKDQLLCIVDDNGIGIKKSLGEGKAKAYKSVGVENTRNRVLVLKEKYKKHYDIIIKDKTEMEGVSESGTVAILSMPIMHKTN